MSKFDNVDYAITPMMKTTKFITSDGDVFEDSLSIVHVRDYAKLMSMPSDISDAIAPGSLAYVAGMTVVWQKKFDGSWEEAEI